ncbi:NAD(P)-dependent oxidoreductase [Sulfuracidifex metallicus]|uniref:NAD(P)-dependent oxidoreductase n=1 Tax=Sulfuracidifex metallicus TaxID=47303 RepID=UPI0022756E7C|nr:NAD(P)-binding domain-containing protein [Sulfuracidifex metallicus]MCY0850967.1 NAD(P)-binding domain-containing protein [Sulfuracidifex metallicus]
MKTIGIVGLGRMGSGMCNNLSKKGYQVLGYDVNPDSYSRCHAIPVEISQMAEQADVIILSLPTGAEVKQALEKLKGFKGTIVDTTTLSVDETLQILDQISFCLDYFTCRLERGPREANEGTLALYCGGDRQTYEKLSPLLSDLGEHVYLGSHVQATMVKLLGNIIGTVMVVLNGEISSIMRSIGLDPELAARALSMGGANNAQLFRLVWQVRGEHQESFSLDLAQHVVEMAIESSKRYGVKYLPLTELANGLMITAKSLGFGKKDVSEVSKLMDLINSTRKEVEKK